VSLPTFPLRAAAALFLERQWLDRPRGRRLTARSLQDFVAATGGLQLDSINVVERAHYVTAWSRFGPYDRASFDRLVYRRRVLFEYWSHVACMVATRHFPAWRRAMLDYERGHKGWSTFLRKHARVIEEVERAIAEQGPLGNADFQHRRPTGGRAGWWNWKPATHALDFLFMKGRIAVASRTHFHKRFDLIERVLPGALSEPPLTPEAFRRWHVVQSLRAMGAATLPDLNWYMTFPRRFTATRRATLRALEREGAVVEIAIEGARGRWFALREDLDALAAAGRRRQASRGATLLSPFDSFLWHRERTRRLFGFDYRIEVYVPAHKRTHGYYSLPILVDGHLVGKADVKNHRERRRLELRHVGFEPWVVKGTAAPAASWGVPGRDRVLAGLAEAAGSLADFIGAATVAVSRVSPPAWRAPLQRALAGVPSPSVAPLPDAPPTPEEVEAPS